MDAFAVHTPSEMVDAVPILQLIQFKIQINIPTGNKHCMFINVAQFA